MNCLLSLTPIKSYPPPPAQLRPSPLSIHTPPRSWLPVSSRARLHLLIWATSRRLLGSEAGVSQLWALVNLCHLIQVHPLPGLHSPNNTTPFSNMYPLQLPPPSCNLCPLWPLLAEEATPRLPLQHPASNALAWHSDTGFPCQLLPILPDPWGWMDVSLCLASWLCSRDSLSSLPLSLQTPPLGRLRSGPPPPPPAGLGRPLPLGSHHFLSLPL